MNYCEKCGNSHTGGYGSGRFCSIECARGFSTKDKRAEINERVSLKLSVLGEHVCKRCGQLFDRRSRLAAHSRIHWTEIKPFEELSNDGARKKRLLKERGHKCEICLNETWQNQSIPIEMDHINGNADDSSISNLRLICPNCHAQTPTYKRKNTACESRKKRYETYMKKVAL
jgi:hypothetical protein